MGEWMDKASGTAKEVGGAATGNRRLEAEGKFERARGNLKGMFEQIKQGFKDFMNRNRSPQRPVKQY